MSSSLLSMLKRVSYVFVEWVMLGKIFVACLGNSEKCFDSSCAIASVFTIAGFVDEFRCAGEKFVRRNAV